jgi:hypothetical protein
MSSDKKSPAVPLSLEYQEANRLHLAILDMQDARKYLHAHEVLRAAGGAAPDVDETLYEALIIAAIVAYCRPFSWNRGDGHALVRSARTRLLQKGKVRCPCRLARALNRNSGNDSLQCHQDFFTSRSNGGFEDFRIFSAYRSSGRRMRVPSSSPSTPHVQRG